MSMSLENIEWRSRAEYTASRSRGRENKRRNRGAVAALVSVVSLAVGIQASNQDNDGQVRPLQAPTASTAPSRVQPPEVFVAPSPGESNENTLGNVYATGENWAALKGEGWEYYGNFRVPDGQDTSRNGVLVEEGGRILAETGAAKVMIGNPYDLETGDPLTSEEYQGLFNKDPDSIRNVVGFYINRDPGTRTLDPDRYIEV